MTRMFCYAMLSYARRGTLTSTQPKDPDRRINNLKPNRQARLAMNNELFDVRLSGTHPGYQTVNLCRRPGKDHYVVVIVDLQKLILYSDQHLHSSFVIPPAENWTNEERKRMFDFLAPPSPEERHVEMPIVSFNEVQVLFREPVLKFFSRRRERLLRYVGYTNGRHRTRYLHFAGALAIPVMCHESQSQLIQRYCG